MEEMQLNDKRQRPKQKGALAIKILTAVTIVLAILCVVKLFVLDFYTIEGNSMEPTFHSGQSVFVRKVGGANRFDAVIIKNTETYLGDMTYNGDKVGRLIKRVVAVEGDVIWSENGVLCVRFDGEDHRYDEEDYGGGLLSEMPSYKDIDRQTVPQGKVFVLGDNRTDSIDSRTFGFVDKSDIEAVVL